MPKVFTLLHYDNTVQDEDEKAETYAFIYDAIGGFAAFLTESHYAADIAQRKIFEGVVEELKKRGCRAYVLDAAEYEEGAIRQWIADSLREQVKGIQEGIDKSIKGVNEKIDELRKKGDNSEAAKLAKYRLSNLKKRLKDDLEHKKAIMLIYGMSGGEVDGFMQDVHAVASSFINAFEEMHKSLVELHGPKGRESHNSFSQIMKGGTK